MATFQMETRQHQQQQQQQQQRTNLKQRAAAAATTTTKRQRQQRHTNPVHNLNLNLKESSHFATQLLAEAEAKAKATTFTSCTRLQPTCSTVASPSSRRSSSRRGSNNNTTSNSNTSRSSHTTSRGSSSSISTGSNRNTIVDCSSCQRALIMLSMLVVVIVVISGNGVLAAQRDSYKSKDMSSSNNAIPNEGDAAAAAAAAAAAGAAAANGVTGSGSMTSTTNSNGSNKNSHTANTGSVTTDSSSSSSSGSSSSSSSNYKSNANANAVTTTTTTISGIPSSSLHKGNTIASPASGSGINRNSIDLIDDSRNGGPYFDKGASKNVTALLGKTAYLNCRVKNLGNKTMLLQVSWVRHRDIHLLTVGRYTYTSDQRFRAIHQPQTEDWMLQIKYPQHRDSGIYECQVSTTPHMSHYIQLTVVEPSTEIIGAPDLYIESGSTINLTCVILNSPEPPAYIFWNHNNAIINYDSPRGGVSVVTNKGETTTSFLLIKSARPSDSGHYQCNPSNAKPKSVTVHVLNGEFPAAMQHAAQAHPHMSPSRYLLVYLFVCFCSLAFARRSMRPSVVQLRQRRRPAEGGDGGAEVEAGGVEVGSASASATESKRLCRYPVCDTSSSVF
ncbi:uncharacterized protein LOC117574830 isoform X2 [Drosophila albomicans]|uniref:Uncharacterized protein LOC117574830 isoform X2 n=1 Tax=Drosophila albomicans TaxID=7291 RepID=A0A6P8ZD47_DROAB|nr:uncharacterized protein LOC117574830 isoform X2 [Drosophila albomicans]